MSSSPYHFTIITFLFLISQVLPQDNICNIGVHTLQSASSFHSSCRKLIGRFLISEVSKLSDEELTDRFRRVREIEGVIEIRNTNLTVISFLRNLTIISGDPLDKMLLISDNADLKSIDISSLRQADGRVLIQKNPQLDLRPNCDTLHNTFFTRRFITDNQFDCGCEIKQPFKEAKNFPENCIVLYGNIQIIGSAPSINQLKRLETVQKLYGSIRIEQTNIETLGFLQNLRVIETDSLSDITISIYMNVYLGRLDLIYLNSIKSRHPFSTIEVAGNTMLCLDPAFVQVAAKSSVYSVKVRGEAFCANEFINNPSIYCRGPLSAINDRCTRYIGDMLYFNIPFMSLSSTYNFTKIPQKDLRKMQQLEIVFGTILIEGSNYTSFSLPNLQEIYQVADINQNFQWFSNSPVIVLQNNYLLEEIEFPQLKIAFSLVRLHEGNTNLTLDDDLCRRISNGTRRMLLATRGDYDCSEELFVVTTWEYTFRAVLGGADDCGELTEVEGTCQIG